LWRGDALKTRKTRKKRKLLTGYYIIDSLKLFNNVFIINNIFISFINLFKISFIKIFRILLEIRLSLKILFINKARIIIIISSYIIFIFIKTRLLVYIFRAYRLRRIYGIRRKNFFIRIFILFLSFSIKVFFL
jgi:hypothetical protein